MKYFLMLEGMYDGCLHHHTDENDDTILFSSEEEARQEGLKILNEYVPRFEVHKCNDPNMGTYTEQ